MRLALRSADGLVTKSVNSALKGGNTAVALEPQGPIINVGLRIVCSAVANVPLRAVACRNAHNFPQRVP